MGGNFASLALRANRSGRLLVYLSRAMKVRVSFRERNMWSAGERAEKREREGERGLTGEKVRLFH